MYHLSVRIYLFRLNLICSNYLVTEYSNNRLYCKLPYQLNGNSTNLYFCSKLGNSPNLPSCIKTDDTIQECVLGKYIN